MSDTNEPAAGTQQQQPAMNILVQYIKDLSFENPNAPATLRPSQQQPQLDINVNVSATKHEDGQFEVTLSLEAKAVSNGMAMFAVELVYCSIFRIQGIPEEHMHPFVLIECPRMLFPFARQIISDCTRNGGFPPLMIDPIDFAALYRQNMAQGNTQSLN
ncbi:protein-export chaperone SecB [Breoghania sp.]|uniref:protein-export chaperone SecB n=1 Tax=Breoghania sp. TaxID=2065378 RepID=UPI00261B46C1|nr:protein-export chaperone SecB [Breoghania sp.]MDJ0930341.1 protein-export chaperone SecB [Breoghania sp.]